ncbi:hypothetical protein [Streptomyces sp. NPDC005438]|uniref:hypothetical protein n=1 Tax=Streptomyces sp. NPDC005438 TaxID=3156880 RepID=UPI00339E1840
MSASRPDPPAAERHARRALLWDLALAVLGVGLFTLAVVEGRSLREGEDQVRLRWPPLYGYWLPHTGPGTPLALACAGLALVYGPRLARSLPWRGLLYGGWAASLAWSGSLALVDGWERGVTRRLTTRYEYLNAVDEVHSLGGFLSGFVDRIPKGAPDSWPAHVSGHPPGALLTFVGLDRIGLSGGGWAAGWCLLLGSSAVVAVLVTLRALAGERLARTAAPFVVLAPWVVWMGVSADGYFAAVAAWGLALLALALRGGVRHPRLTALGAGLVWGWMCYLSYGLALFALLALAVLLATRRLWPVPWVLLGLACWVVAFTLGGFWWGEGYRALVERYYDGAAGVRSYGYFVWANLAVQLAVVGLATLAGLRRGLARLPAAVREWGRGPLRGTSALVVLVTAAVLTVLVADLSGMSKAETERIWLPFSLWLLPACALLPDRAARWWLALQAVTALTVNHLLVTGW